MKYDVEVKSSKDYTFNTLTITDIDGQREYRDYGQPEDNSFLRDYSWIEKELRTAYLNGRMDKENESYSQID